MDEIYSLIFGNLDTELYYLSAYKSSDKNIKYNNYFR